MLATGSLHSSTKTILMPDYRNGDAPGKPGLKELDEAECLRLISPGGIGRIVYSGQSGVTVLPVNYKLHQGAIVFRTAHPNMPWGVGIWTRDISRVHALAKKLRAGTVWINCYNVFDTALPFGGYKQSGRGREMGPEVLNNYTEVKAVTTLL